jgi:hypothetical protein
LPSLDTASDDLDFEATANRTLRAAFATPLRILPPKKRVTLPAYTLPSERFRFSRPPMTVTRRSVSSNTAATHAHARDHANVDADADADGVCVHVHVYVRAHCGHICNFFNDFCAFVDGTTRLQPPPPDCRAAECHQSSHAEFCG